MKRLNLFFILLFIFTLTAQAKTQADCARAALPGGTAAGAAIDTRLAANDFSRERNAQTYQRLLRAAKIPEVHEFLKALHAGDPYLDAGSGDAVAVREFLRMFTELEAVAVAYKKPEAKGLDEALRNMAARFQYIDGGKIEELAADPDSKLHPLLGQVAFLTDIFGPAAYSTGLDALFNTYADLLRPGGQALILFWETDTVFSVNDIHGRPSRPTLRELRDLIPVMTGGRLIVREARMQAPDDWPQFEATVFWLERTATAGVAPVEVFETLSAADGSPPKREIRVHLPSGFQFDREAARDDDMKRVQVDFKRAYVPDAFKFQK